MLHQSLFKPLLFPCKSIWWSYWNGSILTILFLCGFLTVLRMSGGVGLSHRRLWDECLPTDSSQVPEGDCGSHRRQRHICPQCCPEHCCRCLQCLWGPSLQTNWKRKIEMILLSYLFKLHEALCTIFTFYLYLSFPVIRERHEHAGRENQAFCQEDSSSSCQAECAREVSKRAPS